jgi:long-subunit acyl-CoA synthetase (AMP-forming)
VRWQAQPLQWVHHRFATGVDARRFLLHVADRLTYALLLLLLLLQGFEAIKGVLLEPEQFSVDNDCLTPTFKFKRPQLQKRYQVRPAGIF